MEAGGAVSDSGTDPPAEAGTSGPAEASGQAANDNVASFEPANDNFPPGDGEAPGGQPEAGMSGPAEAADQVAANDNTPQAANDNVARDPGDLTGQAEPDTEAGGDRPGSATYEAGEGDPPEAGDEVSGLTSQEVPEPGNEAPEPVNEAPDEAGQEVPEPATEQEADPAREPGQVEQPQSPGEAPSSPGQEVPRQEVTEASARGGTEASARDEGQGDKKMPPIPPDIKVPLEPTAPGSPTSPTPTPNVLPKPGDNPSKERVPWQR
jgi:hypothetical protein